MRFFDLRPTASAPRIEPMAARKRKSNSHRKRAPRARRKTTPTESAPLLVVDQTPILKKALAQCRRLRTELDKKQARLRRFEEEEIPAYQRWFNVEFGARLTELRELQESLAEYEFVAEQLGWCEMCQPEKITEVYLELMRRMKEGTLHAFEPPPADKPYQEEDGFDFDEIFDDLDDAFASFFGSGDEDDTGSEDDTGDGQEAFGRSGEGPVPGRHSSPAPETMALKSLYRTLAKRLHPDHSDLEESLRERRWDELQIAYNAHDLEALQRIEAVCDMEDKGGLSIRLGLARLRDLTAYHRSHVQPIRNALRKAKRHPAFDFAKAERTKLRREVEAELYEQRAQLLHQRHWLREMFEQFAEDTAECADPREPEEADSQEDEGDDFWDSYTAWRDEELKRASGNEPER